MIVFLTIAAMLVATGSGLIVAYMIGLGVSDMVGFRSPHPPLPTIILGAWASVGLGLLCLIAGFGIRGWYRAWRVPIARWWER